MDCSHSPDSCSAPLSIAIGIVWKGDRILIARRRDDAHLPNLWELPGGKCLAGESLEDCLLREVFEETALRVEVRARRDAISFTYPDRQVELHPFDCEWVSGEPQPLGCAECRWVAPEELNRYTFPPANEGLLKELAAGRFRQPG